MGTKNNSLIPKTLKTGDYVLVYWVDFAASHTGQKKDAELAASIDGGFFDGFKKSEGERCIVLRSTMHPHGQDEAYEGWAPYALKLVKKVQIIAKAKEIKWPTYRTG